MLFIYLLLASKIFSVNSSFSGSGSFTASNSQTEICGTDPLDGYLPIAMNSDQYRHSEYCGRCLSGNIKYNNETYYLKGLINSLCEDCPENSFNIVSDNTGNFTIEDWDFIDCYSNNVKFDVVESNAYYGRLKIGVVSELHDLAPINFVLADGTQSVYLTPNDYWIIESSCGNLGCNVIFTVVFIDYAINYCLDGSLFGGKCDHEKLCNLGLPAPTSPGPAPHTPVDSPTMAPTASPTMAPTQSPTMAPTSSPTMAFTNE